MLLGLYQHYKGNYYQVIGMCRHSETLEEMVVYRTLYPNYGLWVRPKQNFEEIINHHGNEVARFQFIHELDNSPPELR